MTRVLLDTLGYAAFLRGHPEVLLALQHAEEIYVTPVILGELLAGFRRGKSRQKNERELWTFLASPRVRVVEINEETAERYAVILDSLWSAGTPIPTNDIWIASSAMQHGLPVLTLDAHYERVSQVMVRTFDTL